MKTYNVSVSVTLSITRDSICEIEAESPEGAEDVVRRMVHAGEIDAFVIDGHEVEEIFVYGQGGK